MGLVARIKTRKSPDVTYDQPQIILWGAAEITTGLICVCIPPLAALTRPRVKSGQAIFLNAHYSDARPKDSSRRTRLMMFEEHGLFTSSNLELQYSGAAPGVVSGVRFPPPLVITGIPIERDTHRRKDEHYRFEDVGQEFPLDKVDEETQASAVKTARGVTTTVEFLGDRAL